MLATFIERHDLVFSDDQNHASIVDGIRLSRAKRIKFRHCDIDHLATQLKDVSASSQKFLVTESLFSMDGDEAPLKQIVELSERYDAMTMVDEAHATGVYEPDGAGLVSQLRLGERVLVQM